MESTALKVETWMKRFGLFAAMVLIAALFCFTIAAAEPAADITSSCKFNAASGRKSFNACKDRNYKTYWKTSNGDKGYVMKKFVTLSAEAQKALNGSSSSSSSLSTRWQVWLGLKVQNRRTTDGSRGSEK